jgi:hypothetical protein
MVIALVDGKITIHQMQLDLENGISKEAWQELVASVL